MTTDLLKSELEKIDVIMERTKLKIQDARELLADADWDVMEALVIYEQEAKVASNQWEVRGHEVLAKVKQMVQEGNITHIRVQSQGRTIVEIPVTLGVVTTVFAPKLALLAAATCMLTKCTIEFDRKTEKLVRD